MKIVSQRLLMAWIMMLVNPFVCRQRPKHTLAGACRLAMRIVSRTDRQLHPYTCRWCGYAHLDGRVTATDLAGIK
jgi:predicted Zn-ribbon and HTH transcriptional regulator